MAINWHAVRETAKVEAICNFLEFTGFGVHRWSGESLSQQSTSARAIVVVVCSDYLRLSRFQRELTKARESKTPLVYVWLESKEPKRLNNLHGVLFDELIYDNDENRFHEMVLEKINVIMEPINDDEISEDSGSTLVEDRNKFQFRKLHALFVIIAFLLAMAGLAMGLCFKPGQHGKLFSLINKDSSIPVDPSEAPPISSTSSSLPATTTHRKSLYQKNEVDCIISVFYRVCMYYLLRTLVHHVCMWLRAHTYIQPKLRGKQHFDTNCIEFSLGPPSSAGRDDTVVLNAFMQC